TLMTSLTMRSLNPRSPKENDVLSSSVIPSFRSCSHRPSQSLLSKWRCAWRVMSVLLLGVRVSVEVDAVHLGAVEIGGAELRRNGGESGRRENDRRGQPYERPADA